MARSRYRLTPALQEQIVAFIRAGGYPHVAAEAAGLPRDVFERWMERGQRSGAPAAYRAFAQAVMEAQAQARLHAELAARTDKPLDWLKAGPGKDSAANPGWTNPGKPRDAPAAKTDKAERLRIWCAVLDLFGRCVEQLAPYPEARAALAAWLKELPADPPNR
ncbi:MAG TPA: hypothetical protein VH682_14115 [Gemmataceae bacterium]|jgi:hypothetical protein